MSALNTLADLVFCNVLFCLFSLPVITTGAALCALYDCTLSIVEQREASFIAAQFWKAFRRNLKPGILLYLFSIIIIILLWAYSGAVGTLSGTVKNIYQITFFVLLFLFLSGSQYLFPLQARNSRTQSGQSPRNLRDQKNPRNPQNSWRVIKSAWFLSAAALPQTLCCLAIDILAVYISFFMNPNAINTAIFLWAFLGFGVVAYLHSFFLHAAFRKLPEGY